MVLIMYIAAVNVWSPGQCSQSRSQDGWAGGEKVSWE